MYPRDDLNRIAIHKAAVRRRIARRRVQCAVAASRVLQPLAWLDRLAGLARRYAVLVPLAAIPLALLARNSSPAPVGFFRRLMKWAPLAVNVLQGLTAARRR